MLSGAILYANDKVLEYLKRECKFLDRIGWHELYRDPSTNTYWRLDVYDRLQVQFVVRINSPEHWQDYDSSNAEMDLLKEAKGVSIAHCSWNDCNQNALNGLVFCERHAYIEMGVRR